MMATAAEPRYRVYTLAAGGMGPLAVPFRLQASGHLLVTRHRGGIRTVLTPGADYTLGGNAATASGFVTLTQPGQAGDRITIEGNAPIARAADFTAPGPVRSASFEAEFERRVNVEAELASGLNRALRVPAGDELPDLPPFSGTQDQVIVRDADGTLRYAPFGEALGVANDSLALGGRPAASVLADVDAAIGLDDPIALRPAPGNTGRSLRSRLANVIDVADYGAIGDDATSNTNAFKLADAAAVASGRSLFVGPGIYRLGAGLAAGETLQLMAPIQIAPGARLKSEPGSVVRVQGGLDAPATQVFEEMTPSMIIGRFGNGRPLMAWWNRTDGTAYESMHPPGDGRARPNMVFLELAHLWFTEFEAPAAPGVRRMTPLFFCETIKKNCFLGLDVINAYTRFYGYDYERGGAPLTDVGSSTPYAWWRTVGGLPAGIEDFDPLPLMFETANAFGRQVYVSTDRQGDLDLAGDVGNMFEFARPNCTLTVTGTLTVGGTVTLTGSAPVWTDGTAGSIDLRNNYDVLIYGRSGERMQTIGRARITAITGGSPATVATGTVLEVFSGATSVLAGEWALGVKDPLRGGLTIQTRIDRNLDLALDWAALQRSRYGSLASWGGYFMSHEPGFLEAFCDLYIRPLFISGRPGKIGLFNFPGERIVSPPVIFRRGDEDFIARAVGRAGATMWLPQIAAGQGVDFNTGLPTWNPANTIASGAAYGPTISRVFERAMAYREPSSAPFRLGLNIECWRQDSVVTRAYPQDTATMRSIDDTFLPYVYSARVYYEGFVKFDPGFYSLRPLQVNHGRTDWRDRAVALFYHFSSRSNEGERVERPLVARTIQKRVMRAENRSTPWLADGSGWTYLLTERFAPVRRDSRLIVTVIADIVRPLGTTYQNNTYTFRPEWDGVLTAADDLGPVSLLSNGGAISSQLQAAREFVHMGRALRIQVRNPVAANPSRLECVTVIVEEVL